MWLLWYPLHNTHALLLCLSPCPFHLFSHLSSHLPLVKSRTAVNRKRTRKSICDGVSKQRVSTQTHTPGLPGLGFWASNLFLHQQAGRLVLYGGPRGPVTRSLSRRHGPLAPRYQTFGIKGKNSESDQNQRRQNNMVDPASGKQLRTVLVCSHVFTYLRTVSDNKLQQWKTQQIILTMEIFYFTFLQQG